MLPQFLLVLAVLLMSVVFSASGAALFRLGPVAKETKAVACLAVAAVMGGTAVMAAELFKPEPLLNFVGEEVDFSGTVVMEKRSRYGRSLLLRPEGGALFRRRVWVFAAGEGEPEGKPWNGWKLKVQGTVEKPEPSRNPGGFDQRTYLRTLGVQAVIRAEEKDVSVLDSHTEWSADFRWMLERRWEPVMGSRSCGGLMSLLFGASDAMEEETLDAFQRIGLGHLLAVSGLHVGLVYSAVQKALGERGKSPPAQALCALAAVAYAALAGFSASASRAALMMVIHSAGKALGRPYDMATSASLAGMMILIRQPCQIASGGFQLSLLAAFGMACVLPRISYSLEALADRKRSRKLRLLAEQGGAAAAVQLVMGPICARRFHCFCLWSPVLNPLCIAAAGMLIPMAMALMAATVLSRRISAFGPLFYVLCRLTGEMMAGMMNLGETVAALPGNFVTAGPPPGALALYYCGLFTWSSERFFLLLRKNCRRIVALWVAAMAAGCCVFPFWAGLSSSPLPFSYLEYPVVFVDVGQGDCFHMRTPGGKNILIDGGGSAFRNVGRDTLLPYLLNCGVASVDLALATHLHMDHFQGIRELAEEIPVKCLGVYEANAFREDGEFGSVEGTAYFKAGDRIEIEPGIWIDVLAPPKRSPEEYRALCADESDENASCLVFLVNYRGLRILITGDMGMEGERELLRRGDKTLQAHILKVGHHGSRYSTSEEFLEAVGPRMAAISVGRNYFGHPSERVIELLEKNDIIVGRTDCHGALIVKSVKKGQAEVISGNGERQWHINLDQNRQKTENTLIRESKNS